MEQGHWWKNEEIPSSITRFAPWVLIAFIAYVISDLSILSVRDELLPSPPSPETQIRRAPTRAQRPLNYAAIIERNIFSSSGVVPDPLGYQPGFDEERAVLTNFPIELYATIVHGDPDASIALIRRKGEEVPIVGSVGDPIEGIGEIVGIRRGRVYFMVSSTRRLEFAELPVDQPIPLGEFGTTLSGVTRESDRQFSVERSSFDAKTQNLGSILQQAKAVPHLSESGEFDGFRLEFIQKGSVFEQLGLRPGDIIQEVNGQAIDNPSKAVELYNQLRTESSIQVQIVRGGRTETLSYSIN
jgi:general secretion pathway protein C